MTLRHIPLEQIDQSHLQRLIDEPVSESRDIEYKRDTYGTADRDVGEFLADISSLANTVGGEIIIGMEAQSGVPISFAPLQLDADREKLRLENAARSGLQPRIFGFSVQAVPFAAGGCALVLRVPRSFNQPHRIVRQGSGNHRFFARSSAGKYEPNVDELRALFTRAPQLSERVRDFRADRIAKITARDVPIQLMGDHPFVVHVAPLAAFEGRQDFHLDMTEHPQQLVTAFPPIGTDVGQVRINMDGCLVLPNLGADGRTHRAYTQIYHSGIVEAVDSRFVMGDGTRENAFRLTSIRMEGRIVGVSHTYLRALLARGAEPPFVVLVSLMSVKGISYSFAMGGSLFEDEAGILDRDQFHFSEMIVEDVPHGPYEYARLIRPLLDQTANAAGRATSPSFDAEGQFRVRI